MNNIPDDRRSDMLLRPRLMAAKIHGIWRSVTGTYIDPLSEPWTAKIILNGREIVTQKFIDFDGCNNAQVMEEVIIRNLHSLPPPPKKKQLFNPNRPPTRGYATFAVNTPDYTLPPDPGMQWAFRTNNDGRIEAVQIPALQVQAEQPQAVAPEPPVQRDTQQPWEAPINP